MRDTTDHFRFSPIQTHFAQDLCQKHGMPADLSTAILFDGDGGHVRSDAVLRLFPYLGLPLKILAIICLWLIPRFVRDYGYCLVARNRGRIWKGVKRVCQMGDTDMKPYRDRILGLEEPLDPSWGFAMEDSK